MFPSSGRSMNSRKFPSSTTRIWLYWSSYFSTGWPTKNTWLIRSESTKTITFDLSTILIRLFIQKTDKYTKIPINIRFHKPESCFRPTPEFSSRLPTAKLYLPVSVPSPLSEPSSDEPHLTTTLIIHQIWPPFVQNCFSQTGAMFSDYFGHFWSMSSSRWLFSPNPFLYQAKISLPSPDSLFLSSFHQKAYITRAGLIPNNQIILSRQNQKLVCCQRWDSPKGEGIPMQWMFIPKF